MIDDKEKNAKLKAIFSAFIFSIVLMIFPVASGVIVAINKMDNLKGYWVQGSFMMLSIIVPAFYMRIKKIRLAQIGFIGIEKDSLKTVLYFLPLIVAKIGFFYSGIKKDVHIILALIFFTIAIGLSEEIYFRGIILKKLTTSYSLKQTVILSAAFFALVHASQAFSGVGLTMTALTIVNALIFGIIAAEVVFLTKSIVYVIIWHAMYDFVNWISLVEGTTEVIIILIQSIIMIMYAVYLWGKLYDK